MANKFYLVLNASMPGATWQARDDAARAAADAVAEKIRNAFNVGRTAVSDYPDDNRPVPGEDAFFGLDPTSRGYSVEVVISASRDERTALSVGEAAALVDECPGDIDGRAWGNTSGV